MSKTFKDLLQARRKLKIGWITSSAHLLASSKLKTLPIAHPSSSFSLGKYNHASQIRTTYSCVYFFINPIHNVSKMFKTCSKAICLFGVSQIKIKRSYIFPSLQPKMAVMNLSINLIFLSISVKKYFLFKPLSICLTNENLIMKTSTRTLDDSVPFGWNFAPNH